MSDRPSPAPSRNGKPHTNGDLTALRDLCERLEADPNHSVRNATWAELLAEAYPDEHAEPPPPPPTAAMPGWPQKVDEMARRAERGYSLFTDKDEATAPTFIAPTAGNGRPG